MQQEVRNYWRALEWGEEQLEVHRQPSEVFNPRTRLLLARLGGGGATGADVMRLLGEIEALVNEVEP